MSEDPTFENDLTLRDARRLVALLARFNRDLDDARRVYRRLLRLLAQVNQPELTLAAKTQCDVCLLVLVKGLNALLAGEDEQAEDEGGVGEGNQGGGAA